MTMDNGKWTMDNGKWTMDNRRENDIKITLCMFYSTVKYSLHATRWKIQSSVFLK